MKWTMNLVALHGYTGIFPCGKTAHHHEAADGPRGLTPNYTVAFDPMPLCIPDENELRGRRVRRGSR